MEAADFDRGVLVFQHRRSSDWADCALTTQKQKTGDASER
jgi:hypothetical protein